MAAEQSKRISLKASRKRAKWVRTHKRVNLGLCRRRRWCCDWREMGKSHGMAWRWKKKRKKEAKSERRSFAWKNRFIVFHWKWIIFSNYVSIAFFLFLLFLHTPPTPLTALTARASISPSFLSQNHTAQQRTITYLKFARNSTKRIYLYIPFRIIFFHFTSSPRFYAAPRGFLLLRRVLTATQARVPFIRKKIIENIFHIISYSFDLPFFCLFLLAQSTSSLETRVLHNWFILLILTLPLPPNRHHLSLTWTESIFHKFHIAVVLPLCRGRWRLHCCVWGCALVWT